MINYCSGFWGSRFSAKPTVYQVRCLTFDIGQCGLKTSACPTKTDAHTHRHRIHSGPLLGHAEFNQTHLLSVKFPCLFSSFFWGLRLYILKRYPTGGNLNSRTAILFGWFLKKLASNMTFIAAQGAALLMRWRTLTWPGEKFPKSSNRGYSWPSQIARG